MYIITAFARKRQIRGKRKGSTFMKDGVLFFLSLSLKIYGNWSENLYPGYVIYYGGKNMIKTCNGDLRRKHSKMNGDLRCISVYMNGDLRYTFGRKVE